MVIFSDMEKKTPPEPHKTLNDCFHKLKKSINRATVNSFPAQEYNVTINSIGVITFMKNGDYNL